MFDKFFFCVKSFTNQLLTYFTNWFRLIQVAFIYTTLKLYFLEGLCCYCRWSVFQMPLKAHFHVWNNFWQLKALQKWWKMLFISPKKLFSFSHVTKRLDMKDKVNSKFYNVTGWLANNRNTHIVQYFEKQRQPDNEIWSVKGTKSRS